MRVLILSCNTGQGHNSAAKAIKERLLKRNVDCEIMDALAFWSERNSKIISDGHVRIYRSFPHLFGIGYRFEEQHPAKPETKSLMYKLAIKGCRALLTTLETTGVDVVICTHVFSAMMMTELRKRGEWTGPTYFVATDYTCSPGVSELMVDGYCIPSVELIPEFVKAGLDRQLLYSTGIPVHEAFYHREERATACRKLKLPADQKNILLMGGSMGCGPMKTLAKHLADELPAGAHLTVICGNNRRHYQSISKSCGAHVTVVGYTTRMSLYMDAADLMISKPGGLCSSEAATKHLPMILVDAVPGCETRNRQFFIAQGYAKTADGIKPLLQLICQTVENEQRLVSMRERLRQAFTRHAADAICDLIGAPKGEA